MTVAVLVVVLGDLGHSPRMVRHIQELLRNGYKVDCIGYVDSEIPFELKSEQCKVHKLWSMNNRIKAPIYRAFKTIFYALFIIYLLVLRMNPKPVLVISQNPPSLPLMLILPILCWIYRSEWYIDWHNLSYSILGLQYGTSHWMVRMAKWVEYRLGKLARRHLCVTSAMKTHLIEQGYSEEDIMVVRDRPLKQFPRVDVLEIHTLFQRLMNRIPGLDSYKLDGFESTPLTICRDSVGHRYDKPVLIVSSTSWTLDEDFEILFRAIDIVEKLETIDLFPQVLLFITGKGPLRSQFEDRYKTTRWSKFRIFFGWLEYKDYQSLLGCADIGISLHFSSSGLDFPMKIIDMMGRGLPVLSIEFPCALEVIRPRINGILFSDSQELSKHFTDLLIGFPSNVQLLELREQCGALLNETWSESWQTIVNPNISRIISKS